MTKRIIVMTWLFLGINIAIAQEYKPVAQNVYNLEIQNKFIKAPALFSISNEKTIPASVVDNAGILNFNTETASELIAASPENIELFIPLNATKTISLKLYRSDFFTPDFSIVTSSQKGDEVPAENGLHYWGIIDNDYSSIAAISIFKSEVMGMISSPSTGNIILGAIAGDKSLKHIIYRESDFHVSSGPNCSTADVPGLYQNKDLQTPSTSAANCIRLYWEVNYDLFQNKGSIANVTNYVTGIFNQSAILFANDAIPVSLSQLYIWDTASPYNATTTSGLLSQFQSYRNSFNGDLGHLIGIAGGGGIAASTNGLCNSFLDYSQCYSGVSTSYSNVPVFSWTVEVITHEQGHLMGSRHTHACAWNGNNTAIDGCGPAAGYAYEGSCTGSPLPSNGGTIMSYCHLISTGINFSNGFGTQPKNVILNKFNSASCLSSCTPGTSCNLPTGMTTSSITTGSATFIWSGVAGASSYNVRYRITGSTNWTSTTSVTTSLQVNNLTPGTTYEWQVQTMCSGGSSAFTASTGFTTTAVATCGIPTGMNTSFITTTSAIFVWTGPAGATYYNVRYRITGSSTWITEFTTATDLNVNNLSPGSTYEWQIQSVCSGGSSAFTASTNFTTTALVTCGIPSGLNTSSITTTSATFVWSGVAGATSYIVRYRITGSANWSSASATSTSFQVNSLTPGTTYEWQVQTACSGSSSVFTTSTSFTTTVVTTCGIPTGMNTPMITTTSAIFAWTGPAGATYYNVRYRITGSSAWITEFTTATDLNVNNLTPGSTYEWQSQSICPGGSSAFTASTNFTTTALATCGTPSALNTTSITTTSATFVWSGVTGAASYNVRYRITGSTTWTTLTTATNSMQAVSLMPGSNYEWQVKSVCSGASSGFTASVNFTTTSVASCGSPSGVTATSISGTEATISWSAAIGATSYILKWKLVSQTIWSSASNFSTSYFTLTGLRDCSSYEYYVQAVCPSGSSANSAQGSFTTTGCQLNYCSSSGINSSNEYINRVALGTINNTSGNNNGYGDYTTMSTNLIRNNSYLISLTPGFRSAALKEYWTIYIDFNQNGLFTDGGERVASGNSAVAMNLLIKIPPTALTGVTRMRVQMKNSSLKSNSCTTFANGEVEDYAVVITGNTQSVQRIEDVIAEENFVFDNELNVYPNPAKDQLTVSIEGKGEEGKIRMYNSEGRELYLESRILNEGNNKIEINTTELINGLYFISVESEEGVSRKKFMVVK